MAKCKHLQLTGIFSHFASFGSVLPTRAVGQQTRAQEGRFYAALERLRALGIDPGIVQLCEYAAICTRPGNLGGHGDDRARFSWDTISDTDPRRSAKSRKRLREAP